MRSVKTFWLAGAGLGILACLTAADDQPGRPSPVTSFFRFKKVEIQDGDGELRRLLKLRYNAAGEEFAARSQVFLGGRMSVGDVAASLERFVKAGLDLEETQAGRIEHLENSLRAAKNLESVVRDKVGFETEPVHALKHANFVRYDLEIQLHRARELAKGVVPAK